MKTNWTETKSKIEDWIGNGNGFLESLPDSQAEELLFWLEENKINIETETDIDKVVDFITTL